MDQHQSLLMLSTVTNLDMERLYDVIKNDSFGKDFPFI